MPRLPRQCVDASFFHIIVQGLNKEYIFDKDVYIEQYIKLLDKYKEKIKIISYCIMNNHAHILLYTQNILEMSKFMQKVNTEYARYYNYMKNSRVGYVFKDRYISEGIKSNIYLIRCINYIHNNPVKAHIVDKCDDYKYSSYNEFINGNGIKVLEELTDTKFDKKIFRNINDTYVFKDIDIDSNEFIESCIMNFLCISNISREEVVEDRIILKILIKYLKEKFKIKYTDMMSYFKITKGQMNKLKLK